RLGAIAVLYAPDTPTELLRHVLELGETDVVIVDPDGAPRVRAETSATILVLGGVGEPQVIAATHAAADPEVTERHRRDLIAGTKRGLPADVIDLEKIDVDLVTIPSWYRPDQGRARDLAMIFVTSGRHEPARAMRITNRRWAFSALGAAAAATLTTRDTVYCCLPLHHPSGSLVAVGSALVGGARLALASRFEPQTFWDEVRRYGASVVYYAGEMCRRLVDAPSVVGENNSPVRLFAGSGMRTDVWKRLVERFGPVSVCELYASTEAHTVLVNSSGKKVGSVGRALPGSPEVVVAAWTTAADGHDSDFVRDGAGHLIRARLDEPGMLVARLAARAGSDIAHIDPRRILRDAFEPGDTWFVTGDLFEVDTVGDFWFVDRHDNMIATRMGAVASTRIEDAIYDVPGVALCVAVDAHGPVAALQLHAGAALDLAAVSAAVATLPEYARPRRLRVVAEIPMTDGFRPIKRFVRGLDFEAPDADVVSWDPRTQRYAPVAPTT
ncbi:MAG: AMP-binding protein, partial [Proteobacteria bacterium]|nr:AMP-binding protein [Pseudomonadota bacterium]